MPRKPQQVTDAELAILAELWREPKMTVRQLAEVLYASSASNLATVQKLLVRLEAKGCVRRQRDQWPHQFEASVDRDELISRRLQSTADELCEGSLAPLLSNLVRASRLDRKERDRLRNLLDGLEGKRGG